MKDKIILIAAVLGFFLIPITISWTCGAIGCWSKLSDSGYEYKYHLIKGCRYQTDKGWLQYDRLRDLGA